MAVGKNMFTSRMVYHSYTGGNKFECGLKVKTYSMGDCATGEVTEHSELLIVDYAEVNCQRCLAKQSN